MQQKPIPMEQMRLFLWTDLISCQSQQIPYEVVPTIEPSHHSRDIMIDNQEIRLHAWLFDNVLPDLAHIV